MEEPLQQGQQRHKAPMRLQKTLTSNVFKEMFGALISVESLAVTLQEARDLKIVLFIHAKKCTLSDGTPDRWCAGRPHFAAMGQLTSDLEGTAHRCDAKGTEKVTLQHW